MPRCPVCRTRRTTLRALFKHQEEQRHRGPCTCGGYHFPHRPGSPCCEKNPYFQVHQTRRAEGDFEAMLDATIEATFNTNHKPVPRGAPPPF